MRIFQAVVEDVPRILECARQFTSIIPDCPLDEKHYVAAWREFLQSRVGVIFLMEQDGKICGGLGGACHPELLTGHKIAVELFWYVQPEHRGGTHPIRLLHEFETWATAQGCRSVSMIHMECSMPGTMKQMYTRLGYELFETIYRKTLT
jgi:GNAT superfamily N-acetyltransferase